MHRADKASDASSDDHPSNMDARMKVLITIALITGIVILVIVAVSDWRAR
jgi:hypothetical protein